MTDIGKPQDPHRLRNNIFIIAGTVVVVATYLYLILAQPAVVDADFKLNGTAAVIPLVGYVLGALLIAVGAINRLPTTTVVLVPVAILINIVVGQITAALGLPLYLDSIGTILVGVVAGPAAGAVTGGLANNLRNLGDGLTAYADALGDEWNNTVVVVISEFGRTFRENGDKGTDHGHGTAHWVLGGKVNGGRIAGEQIAVDQQNLLQDRDYPVLNNYRDVLGGMLGRVWGLSGSQLQSVFPASKPKDLQLV